jgi:pyruvate/2-oxoglutarate dehydrogenase complex dihydrolipoamide acyltransferase (E2) component
MEADMSCEVIMPRMGLTMEEGTIIKWMKKEGEAVKKGEPLFTIETDKVTTDVESTAEGVLFKILVKENEIVPVLTPVAIINL